MSYPSGSYSVAVASLNPGTTYYYRAVIQHGTKDYYGEVMSFQTQSAQQPSDVPGWLELPYVTTGADFHVGYLGSGSTRNYSYLYDKANYTALWSAYPLTGETGSSKSTSWSYNPDIPMDCQIDVKNSSYGTNYGSTAYNRGHQVPAGDRTQNSTVRSQVYYLTNQTPQLEAFNGNIWASLENAVRGQATQTDTLYVVTGASFRKVGGNETIKHLTGNGVTPASIPVPNYYWKVLLKVKRNSAKQVTSASAIGFWFEHKTYTNGSSYTDYAVSVDQIESFTGFDFFANLPESCEASCETNSSWTSFTNF